MGLKHFDINACVLIPHHLDESDLNALHVSIDLLTSLYAGEMFALGHALFADEPFERPHYCLSAFALFQLSQIVNKLLSLSIKFTVTPSAPVIETR